MQEIFKSIGEVLKTCLEADPKIRAKVIAVYLVGSYATPNWRSSRSISERKHRL